MLDSMHRSWLIALTTLGLVALLATVSTGAEAVDFLEDFESFTPGSDPDQTWYNYIEGEDFGQVNDSFQVIEGTQSMRWFGEATSDASTRTADFRLATPIQLTAINLTIEGAPSGNLTGGSRQAVTIESDVPRRSLVEFYLLCRFPDSPDACELRVRFDHVDSTGQILVNTTLNETRFQLRMEIDWINSQYELFEDGTSAGIFPFLELPRDVGRLQVHQHQASVPIAMSLDLLGVEGASSEVPTAETGDIATGLQNFANNIRFTSSGSEFLLGLLFFLTLLAAVVVPMFALGRDNTTIATVTFFAVLVAFWLILLGFWPEWIGISLIVFAAAAVGLVVRRMALGVQDASTGPSMVLGSLGYFVIASSLLAFSGFATDTIEMPTNPVAQTEEDGADITDTQSFAGAVVECIFTGGAITFGLIGDCSQETTTTTFKRITDSAGRIFGWVQASVNFVFQLITFRLPIPALFNIIIVGPPAMTLAAYAVEVIRGK